MGADLVVRGAKNAVRFFIDTQIEAELIDLKSDVNFLSINDIQPAQTEEDVIAYQYASKFKTSAEDMITRRDQPKARQRVKTDGRTSYTKHMILDSIWIGNDQAIFLTLDNQNS